MVESSFILEPTGITKIELGSKGVRCTLTMARIKLLATRH